MKIFRLTGRVAADRCAALGQVCIHFSILEFKIEQTIWALRGHPRKIGRLQTRRTTFKRRVVTLRKEATKKFGTNSWQYRWFDRFIILTEGLAKDRNFFVHGVWCKGDFAGGRRQTYALSYFDEPTGRAQEIKAEGLHMLRTNIARAISLLDQNAPKILGAPLP